MLKILIVDDHLVVRQGLKQIIIETFTDVVVDEAGNGREVLSKVRETGYDFVTLDISLPDVHGLDILKQLKNEQPELPVLILSIHAEEQYALRALRAGASGYLTKDCASDELIAAIQKVSSGGKYISPSLAERLASALEINVKESPHEILSDREYQVLCFIISGRAMKDIAEQLSLSVKTVSTYRSRILKKMAMKSNAELIRYGVENQLLN